LRFTARALQWKMSKLIILDFCTVWFGGGEPISAGASCNDEDAPEVDMTDTFTRHEHPESEAALAPGRRGSGRACWFKLPSFYRAPKLAG
jgi:hypothetical protein